MDILYTVEERYLQAIEELHYGELPKALHYFNEIIGIDPEYARAYYQVACCYHYQFKNYQTAGYHYKKCIELEPAFPDVYEHYLKLLIVLKMRKTIQQTVEKALQVPGVRKASIYECLGLYAEEEQDLDAARVHYKQAVLAASCQDEHTSLHAHLKRIAEKQDANKTMIYVYQG